MIGRALLVTGFAFAVASLATSPLYDAQWGIVSPLLAIVPFLCALALSYVYRRRPFRQFHGVAAWITIGFAVLILGVATYFNSTTLGSPEHHYWQAWQFFLLACLLLAQQAMRNNPTPS